LGQEALAGEASKAAAGDVHGGVVGGHAKEIVQFADPERLVGVLVEGVRDLLVGGALAVRTGLDRDRIFGVLPAP
jgi:hypothetical protein